MGVHHQQPRRVAVAASVLGLAACADLLDLDDFEGAAEPAPTTVAGPGGAGGRGGADGGSPPTTSSAGGAGGGEATCSSWSAWAPASADDDTGINTFNLDACFGAAHDGLLEVIALGRNDPHRQVGLFRFTLPSEVLMQPATTELRLVLHRRVDDCDQPGCFTDGVLEVRQLINAWDEGMDGVMGPNGATWCRRSGGMKPPEWEEPGALGPTELGAVLGTGAFDDAVASVTIDLDPGALDESLVSNFVSLRVAAVTEQAYVAVHSKESADGTRHPQLEYRTCAD